VNDSSLCNFGLSVSTGALCKDSSKLIALLSSGQRFAEPDNLLKTLLFADLKDDLLDVTKLVEWKSVASVY
jgi:hypothetical protein